ncbi:MAG: hypothetical protein IK016_09335 [Lachnospiraceae bacterium]|nr:hypothetical protein [Lachnospiraceae bacterium]
MKKFRLLRLLLPLLLAAVLAGPSREVYALDESSGSEETVPVTPQETQLALKREMRRQGREELIATAGARGTVITEWDRFAEFTTEQVIHLAKLRSLYNAEGQPVLSPYDGWVHGPSGKDTYYNLDMTGVIERLRYLGFSGEYHVREDGVKMFGEYIMCAADFDLRPIGTIVETSLGKAIVCDTGLFTQWDSYQLDIAVTW